MRMNKRETRSSFERGWPYWLKAVVAHDDSDRRYDAAVR